MLKLSWSYVQGKLPQGVVTSLETIENQRHLRRNRQLSVPRNMGRMGMKQIDVKLPKYINKYYDNLTIVNTKVALIRKMKKGLLSSYREVIVCNNVGCVECKD